jgi:hypothetical protein
MEGADGGADGGEEAGAVQALTLSEPGAETGCAGGHCVHSTLPAVANVPSGHRMQSASEVRKWPAGHSQPQKRA